MRVLINMPSQHARRPSGVALVTFALLEALLARGDANYVLRSPWSREDLPPGLQTPRLDVVVVPRPRIMILDVFLQSLTVPALCRRLGIDLVLNVDPFGASRGGRARITVVHDLYFHTLAQQVGWRAALTMRIIYEWVLAGSARIVTISRATQTDLARWRDDFGAKATTVYPAAVSAEPASTAAPARQNAYVLLVGNSTPNKNFKLAAQAVASLRHGFPDLGMVHVGADPDETLQSEFRRLGSDTPLERLAGIDASTLGALYRDAVCLITPSLSEGFCLPILEAQAQGCPVVCANISAMPEVAGEGALLFPSNDAQRLASQIEALLTDPDLRARLAAAGHRNRARFSWIDSASRYRSILTEALEDARS